MKKIFSSLFLIIWSPFKALKIANKDNFVWGLIFGALFSFVVNVFTIQIQERIAKQRILEAVEWEIYNNSSTARNVIDEAGKIFKNEELPSMFYSYKKYSRDLWIQSTEPLQYIAQLSSNTQASVILYYTVIIPGHNALVESTEKIANTHLSSCFLISGSLNKQEEIECKLIYYQLLNGLVESAGQVSDHSFKVLKEFHPTQDRLRNPLLRLLMGSESVKVLSGQ